MRKAAFLRQPFHKSQCEMICNHYHKGFGRVLESTGKNFEFYEK